jgi:hypothetical protein
MNDEEIAILKKFLRFNKSRLNYYLALAVILIMLSWILFLATYITGFLISALIITFGIGYYPMRYYKIVSNLKEDLLSKDKIELVTLIYAKKISRINRLQPYYYIFTDEEDFEVSEAVFNALNEQSRVRIIYAARSKTIFKFEMLLISA